MFRSLQELVEALRGKVPEALEFFRGVESGALPAPRWWPLPQSEEALQLGLQRGSVPTIRYFESVVSGQTPPPSWWPAPTRLAPRGLEGPPSLQDPGIWQGERAIELRTTEGPAPWSTMGTRLGPAGPGAPIRSQPLPSPTPLSPRPAPLSGSALDAERARLGYPRPFAEQVDPFGPIIRPRIEFDPAREGNVVPQFGGLEPAYPPFVFGPPRPPAAAATSVDVPGERIGFPLGPPTPVGFPGFQPRPGALPIDQARASAAAPTSSGAQVMPPAPLVTPQSDIDRLLYRLERVSNIKKAKEGQRWDEPGTGRLSGRNFLRQMILSDDFEQSQQAKAFLILSLRSQIDNVKTVEEYRDVLREIIAWRAIGGRSQIFEGPAQIIREGAEGTAQTIQGPSVSVRGFSGLGTGEGAARSSRFDEFPDIIGLHHVIPNLEAKAAQLGINELIASGELSGKAQPYLAPGGDRSIWEEIADTPRGFEDAVFPSLRARLDELKFNAASARNIEDANRAHDEIFEATRAQYETYLGTQEGVARMVPELNEFDAADLRRMAERAHNAEVNALLRTVGREWTAPNFATEVSRMPDGPFSISGYNFSSRRHAYMAAIALAESRRELDDVWRVITAEMGDDIPAEWGRAWARQNARLESLKGGEEELKLQRMYGGTEWLRGANKQAGARGLGSSKEYLIGLSEKEPHANPMGIAIVDHIRAKRVGGNLSAIAGGRLAGKRGSGFLPTAEEIEELDIYSRIKPGTKINDVKLKAEMAQVENEIAILRDDANSLLDQGFDPNSPELDEVNDQIAELMRTRDQFLNAARAAGVEPPSGLLRAQRAREAAGRAERYPTEQGGVTPAADAARRVLQRMNSIEVQREIEIEDIFAREAGETIKSWAARLEEAPRKKRDAGSAEEGAIFGRTEFSEKDYRVADQASIPGSDSEAAARWLTPTDYSDIPRVRDFQTREEFNAMLDELERLEDSGRISDAMLRQITDALEAHARTVMGSPVWDGLPPKVDMSFAEPPPARAISAPAEVDISKVAGYQARTVENAERGDVTISISASFDTGGEILTRRSAVNAGTRFLPAWVFSSDMAVEARWLKARIYQAWIDNGRRPIVINGAGNSMETMDPSITQEMYNNYVARLFDEIIAIRPGIVERVVTGGQSGADIAIAHAARRAGIPVTIHPAVVQTKQGNKILVWTGKGEGSGTEIFDPDEYIKLFNLEDDVFATGAGLVRGGGGRDIAEQYLDEAGIQLSRATSMRLRDEGVSRGRQPRRPLGRKPTEAPKINLETLSVEPIGRQAAPTSESQVIVYGSVLKPKQSGSMKGLGVTAARAWDAVPGVSKGLNGRAYALPVAKTDTKRTRQLADEELRNSLLELVEAAKVNSDRTFYLIPEGFSWSGYTRADIARALVTMDVPENLRISGLTDGDAQRFMNEIQKAAKSLEAKALKDSGLKVTALPPVRTDLPPAKNKNPWKMTFRDGRFSPMRPENKGKTTMELIFEGKRTATTRETNYNVKPGDIIDFVDANGNIARVRVTSAPRQLTDTSEEARQRWSELEGWAPSYYNKHIGWWQFEYELLGRVEKATPSAPAAPAARETGPTATQSIKGRTWDQLPGNAPNYEVSSAGDVRFSAGTAQVEGRSIEDHWQADFKGGTKTGPGPFSYDTKGNPPKPGSPAASMTQDEQFAAYKQLWVRFFDENPDLLQEIAIKAAGRRLTDKYASSPISQARAIDEILVERGLRYRTPPT